MAFIVAIIVCIYLCVAVIFYIVVTSFRVSRGVFSCELVSVLCSAFNSNCDYYLSYLIMALHMLDIVI